MDFDLGDYQQLSASAPVFSPAGMVQPPEPEVTEEPPAVEAPAVEDSEDDVERRAGFERLSRRVFIAPCETPAPLVIDELNTVHVLGLNEKNCIRLEPDAWGDGSSSREDAFAASVNRTFKVKGGKPGPRFWKGVREAVMKQCGTQDMVLLVPAFRESDDFATPDTLAIEQVVPSPPASRMVGEAVVVAVLDAAPTRDGPPCIAVTVANPV